MNSEKHISVLTDGTTKLTKVYAPNGDEIEGVTKVDVHPVENNVLPMATITFYLRPFDEAVKADIKDRERAHES